MPHLQGPSMEHHGTIARVCRRSRGSHVRSRSQILPCQPFQAIPVVSHTAKTSHPLDPDSASYLHASHIKPNHCLSSWHTSQRIATTTSASDIELEDDSRRKTWRRRVCFEECQCGRSCGTPFLSRNQISPTSRHEARGFLWPDDRKISTL